MKNKSAPSPGSPKAKPQTTIVVRFEVQPPAKIEKEEWKCLFWQNMYAVEVRRKYVRTFKEKGNKNLAEMKNI